ncbi:MAG TPA: CAP domain-containing protein [Solirubrobacterales bacterium]|nr:CAP domain-containing protein [Solirubrobacterales bacterium]
MRRGITIGVLSAAVLIAVAAPSASAAPCAGQGNAGAAAVAQERAMLCLVNRARVNRGLDPLAAPSSLAWAADRKSADILRCDDFNHEACGRDSEYWVRRSGYDGCAGENIAYASGRVATPRFVFRLWMNSQGHRENILGSYDDIGIGMRIGEIDGERGAHVWTQNFGISGC